MSLGCNAKLRDGQQQPSLQAWQAQYKKKSLNGSN